jgi:hypothetical protein
MFTVKRYRQKAFIDNFTWRKENMITTMPKKELIELGERFRAQYLVERAGYTLGIAAAEGEAMSDLLPR